jgi:hypothetical protein
VAPPGTPGEHLFLHIGAGVIVAAVLLAIVVAKVRRHRRGVKGKWWTA